MKDLGSTAKFKSNVNENENKNATGEDPYMGTLRAPRRFPCLRFCFRFPRDFRLI